MGLLSHFVLLYYICRQAEQDLNLAPKPALYFSHRRGGVVSLKGKAMRDFPFVPLIAFSFALGGGLVVQFARRFSLVCVLRIAIHGSSSSVLVLPRMYTADIAGTINHQ